MVPQITTKPHTNNGDDEILVEDDSTLEEVGLRKTLTLKNKNGNPEPTTPPATSDQNTTSQQQDQPQDDDQALMDFWLCCLAQALNGFLFGATVVYCCNAHRQGYPTRSARKGCFAGFVIVLALYYALFVLRGFDVIVVDEVRVILIN